MRKTPKKILSSYPELSHFVAGMMKVDSWEGDSEYYPLSSADVSIGFLEVVYPVADGSGRLLRGAAGNGPIFIFLYCRGTWTYLGQMHGAKAVAIVTTNTTEFDVYAHATAASGIQRRYQLRGEEYVCVSETDITAK
jgi:hypothetical protein